MSCWELRLLYYIVSKSSLTELNGACRLVLASLEPFFVVSLLVNYPLRVINRIGSSGWQGIAWWRSKCLWNVFSFSRSLFTSSGFMRSHDKVWNRWSSLDPTCPLISGAPPLTFFNNFFHLFQIRDTKPQWVQTSEKISHFKKLIFFSWYFFRGIEVIILKRWLDETFLVVFAYCVMLHETAGILTIITAA